MLNQLIRHSLNNRLLVLVGAILITGYGLFTLAKLPVDVFPDLNRPTVTVMVEAPGLAPEEIETQITFHLETALNGAPGVVRVRSSSGIGLAVIWVEFDWDTEIRYDRQIVQERLNQAIEKLPSDVVPIMAPISSIMGEIMLIGVNSTSLSPMEVRTLSEWVIRPRLLSIAGIAQITAMGGELKQYQVKVDPEKLRRYNLTFEQVEDALNLANENTGGGFVFTQNQEFLVRNLGRVKSIEDIGDTQIVSRDGFPVFIADVAEVVTGAAVKRGDGSVNGNPAVIMAVQKQPGSDTRHLTEKIEEALTELETSLPKELEIESHLFRQANFIEASIDNIVEALRDGAILVVIVLFAFLLNVRTTFITLTAIPLSLLITAIVFKVFGMSINTMTLGGIAVAIGELVDDAIVDVENIFRRLKENKKRSNPAPVLEVVFHASSEIRNAIVFGTAVVLLVFLPLFALSGIEGRLFQPLAVAYITSILMSLVVSLTVTPVLCYYLLPTLKQMGEEHDGLVLRVAKRLASSVYDITLPRPKIVIGAAIVVVGIALIGVFRMGTEFLPPFNEGTATITMVAQPGTSLEESNRLGQISERLILQTPEVKSTGRRTGRAEQDEHAEGVNVSEIDVDFWTEKEVYEKTAIKSKREIPIKLRPREEVLSEIRSRLENLPGVSLNIGQPISHRLDHLLSGVRAQIAVKITGPDLHVLRRTALQVEAAMKGLPGVVDLQVEKQVLVPQVRLRVKRKEAAKAGFKPAELTDTFESAFQGKVVSQVIDGLQSFDLVLWTDQRVRLNSKAISDLTLVSPTGVVVLLSDVADVVETPGPNQVNRENVQRRIVVFCNVAGRDLGSTVEDIKKSVAMDVTQGLPPGYSITYGGQFESQERATRTLLVLGALSLIAMFFLLYSHFESVALVVQVMLNIPFAFIGAVGALVLAGEPFSVASLVGFISLTGISSRNGILMISHYVHLMGEEGMEFGRELVIRGSQERVAPVLMTALTSGLALVPLILARGEPGKEILFPVALVVLGGLTTSTLLDFAITPTVFFNYSGKAAAKVAKRHKETGSSLSVSDENIEGR